MSNWEASCVYRTKDNEHSIDVHLQLKNEKGALVSDYLTPDEARALAKQLKRMAKACDEAWVAGDPNGWPYRIWNNPLLPERLGDL